ncbi:hypothetical protein [Protaetiibacter larvae]|uniref:Uncharacterized protein n=1 Tax=Protaetiibacter larvae TaxID=2592654 RepID=A0A5C1Y6N8_9MICO|nr:hypothetical protein [Protaetiibacter larvae]QEO08875.1 hypothetical protein FLP23_01870 [Protaetiibacter larvae]
MNPVIWIVLAVLAALIALAAVVSARRRTAEPRPGSARARIQLGDDGRMWGLHQPGAPVQRMAKSLAVGFASIDPEETSEVVYSTDGGANWQIIPREDWNR